jgi:hypothetical protein
MHRRCRARKVIDLIDLEQYGFGYVVTNKLEAMIIKQTIQIFFAAGKKIIEADDLIALAKQTLT